MADSEAFGPLAREHLDNPRNLGPLPAGSAPVTGEAGSQASGAYVRFHLVIRNGVIAAVRYEVLGEPALVAAASYLSERIAGRPAMAGAVPVGLELAEALGLPRAEHGAALLAEDAVRRALESAG